MPVVNGYTTVAQVLDTKGITTIDALDDTVIEDLITAVSRYIDRETGRRFYTTAADETRVFQAISGRRCYVDELLSVTTLKTDVDGDRTYENTWATTDYDLLPDNAALDGKPYTWIEIAPNGAYSFPTQRRGVQIVGKFGYCASTPADIARACIETVVNVYNRRYGVGQSAAGAETATVTGAGVVLTPHDIPETAWKTIQQYKRLIYA